MLKWIKSACFTLKTRIAFYHLKSTNQFDKYVDYLKGNITRAELYNLVPSKISKKLFDWLKPK